MVYERDTQRRRSRDGMWKQRKGRPAAECSSAASQFASASPWLAALFVAIKEPAWHRRQRSLRQTSRRFLRSVIGQRIGPGRRARIHTHLARLRSHHSWCWDEIPRLIQRQAAVMTWYCRPCGVQNPQNLLQCRACKKSWEAVWEPPRRKRSKSAWARQNKDKEKKEKKEKHVSKASESTPKQPAVDPLLADDLPWVVSTPHSRIAQRQVRPAEAPGDTLPLVPPPPPVVEPPVASSTVAQPTSTLSEEERKQLTSLRNLQETGMSIPDSLMALLQELEKKEKQEVPSTISHSQVNKLHKLRTQAAALSKKIADLDVRWGSFIAALLQRARDHGQQYQQCRADLLTNLMNRQQELRALKQSMVQASQNLALPSEEQSTPMPGPAINEAMEELQRYALMANAPVTQLIDDDNDDMGDDIMDEEEEEEELVEELPEGETAPRPIKPSPHSTYRASPSPNRVTEPDESQALGSFVRHSSRPQALSQPLSVRSICLVDRLTGFPDQHAAVEPDLRSSCGQWDELSSDEDLGDDYGTDAAFRSLMMGCHFEAQLQIAQNELLRQQPLPTSCLRSVTSAVGKDTKNGVRVRFSQTLEVHLWDSCHSESALLHEHHRPTQLRDLWHLDGQVCSGKRALHIVRQWNHALCCPIRWGPIHNGYVDLSGLCVGSDRKRAQDQWWQEMRPFFSHEVDGLEDLRLAITTNIHRRVHYVEIWFLEEMHGEVCINPRRMQVDIADLEQAVLQRKAVQLWSDRIIANQVFKLVYVHPMPAGRRATIAHYILIQGRHDRRHGIILHSDRLPVLQKYRAILAFDDSNANRLLRTAHVDPLSDLPQATCWVTGPLPSQQTFVGYQRIPLRDGCVVEGHVHIRDDSSHASDTEEDEDGSEGSISQASTDLADSEVISPQATARSTSHVEDSSDSPIGGFRQDPQNSAPTTFVQSSQSRCACAKACQGQLCWADVPFQFLLQDALCEAELEAAWTRPRDSTPNVRPPMRFQLWTAASSRMKELNHSESDLPGIDDVTCLMQRNRSRSRDPTARGSNDSLEEPHPVSEEGEEEPVTFDHADQEFTWQVVYADMEQNPALVDAPREGPTVGQAAYVCGVPLGQIAAVHVVQHLFTGGRDWVAIAEMRNDYVDEVTEAIILFDTLFRDPSFADSRAHPYLFHSVAVLRNLLTYQTVISLFRLDALDVRHRNQFALYLNGHRWHAYDVTPRRLRHGDHLELIVEPCQHAPHREVVLNWILSQALEPWPELLSAGNASTLTPTVPFHAEEPNLVPSDPSLIPDTACHLGFAGVAFNSWYISHTRRGHCPNSRVLILSSDPTAWRGEIARVWQDVYDPATAYAAVWVQPQPPGIDQLAYDLLPHIIIEQDPQRDRVANLVAVVRHDRPQEPTILEAFSVDQFTSKVGFCQLMAPDQAASQFRNCQVVSDHVVMEDPGLVRRLSGQSVVVTVAPVIEQADEASFLQLKPDSLQQSPFVHPSRTVHMSHPPRSLDLDHLVPPPFSDRRYVSVDVQSLIFAYNQLCCLDLPPVQSFHAIVRWHPATIAHVMALPPWQEHLWPQVTCIQFYTDGSSAFDKDNGIRSGASAVVMFAWIEQTQYFVGFRTFCLPGNVTAQRAEHAAILGVAVWCLHTFRNLGFPPTKPAIEVHFDCIAAGFGAAGFWQQHAHTDLHALSRNLFFVLSSWFQAHPTWHHVPAHSGHSGNEAADAACWAALNHWIDSIHLQELINQITLDGSQEHLPSWFWFLDRVYQGDSAMPLLDGSLLRFPVDAPLDSHPVLPQHVATPNPEDLTQDGDLLDICFRAVTANVMTLFPAGTGQGAFISARQEGLLRAFAQQGAHAVGVQETRSQLRGHCQVDGWHILSAPATQKGQGGVQLWLRSAFVFGNQVFKITERHIRITHMSSRRLVVIVNAPWLRLRFLVGHLPCADRIDEAEQWWSHTNQSLQYAASNLPLIALLDANSRVGSVCSAHIQGYQPEEETPSGALLHEWLCAHGMFLPQTFPAYAEDEGHTFRHPTGSLSRIDYVALDQAFHHAELRTRISAVDLAIHRDDHYAVEVDDTPGHRIVANAYHKYLLQEKIAQTVCQAGQQMQAVIQRAGIQVQSAPATPDPVADYPCPACDKRFSTPQGRQAHCWKKHGSLSVERRLAFGVTCRACNQCLWTSARLQQHIRNSRLKATGCFITLAERFLPDPDPEHDDLPEALQHMTRVPAQPAVGPVAPLPPRAFFPPAHHVLEWRQRWEGVGLPLRLLKDDYVHFEMSLNGVLDRWRTAPTSDLLDSAMAAVMDVLEARQLPHPQGEWAFAIWYRRLCVTEESVEDLRARRAIEPFAFSYLALGDAFAELRGRPRLGDLPRLPVPVLMDELGRPTLLVVHLFSGRRRARDFHEWVKTFAAMLLPSFQCWVLSVDTAVAVLDGNLAQGPAVRALDELTRHPAVALMTAGPPCETWTAARRQALTLPSGRKAPRPLRDVAAPWGLSLLAGRELRQLDTANQLMLGGLRWELQTAVGGGGSVMEHPAEAQDEEASSIWRTHLRGYFFEDILEACRAPIEQWQFGSTSRKPTLLRALCLPGFKEGMTASRDVHASLPSKVLLGFDETTNSFRTSAAKEYPEKMAMAMARSAVEALESKLAIFGHTASPVSELSVATQEWIRRLRQSSEQLSTGSFLPDYQQF
eukprot:Skav204194  [mRNA]  locus=scaffold3772:102509:114151:- [translate_table: standard]